MGSGSARRSRRSRRGCGAPPSRPCGSKADSQASVPGTAASAMDPTSADDAALDVFARRNLTVDTPPPVPPPGVYSDNRTVLLMLYMARNQLEQRELGLGRYNTAKEMMAHALLDDVLTRVLGLTHDRRQDDDDGVGVAAPCDKEGFDPLRDVDGWASDRCLVELRGLEAVAGRKGPSQWHGSEKCLAMVQILRGLKDHPEALPVVEAMYREKNGWDEAEKERTFRKKAAKDCCAVCLEVLLPASNYRPRWERNDRGEGSDDEDEGYPLPICSLPCGHRFHGPCIESIRSSRHKGLLQACPACRTELPKGPDELKTEAFDLYLSVSKGGKVVEKEIDGGRAGNYTVWDIGAMDRPTLRTCSEFVRLFKEAADQGQLEAMNWLGQIHYYGEGVPHDAGEAAKWYHRAAEHGHAPSQQFLGFFYQEGFGVSRDEREAAKWYRRAAEQGNAAGQWALGSFYCKGIGVPLDDERAVHWHRKAAEQGEAEAQLMMGIYYKNGVDGVVKRDYSESMRWFAKADAGGHPEAKGDIRGVLAMRKAELEGGKPLPPFGARVRLTGLKAKPELNGRTGIITDFVAESGRCVVRLEEKDGSVGGKESKKMIKLANLEHLLS